MKFLRIFRFFLLFASLSGGFFPVKANPFESGIRSNKTESNRSPNGGIKERIPAQFQDRYLRWKDELLSTEFGRRQWDFYSSNKQFNLIIIVSADKEFAAKTGDYQWDETGELIGATITLGKNLDKGYPNAVYYPVMNSLSSHNSSHEISGNILAATKLAHEIGHVNATAQTKGELFERQNKLMAAYYKIFLRNGYNTNDQRLVELAGELGGIPMQIWADREYWGETNAMRYLAERAGKEKFYCSIFNQIKRNITDYAKNYEDRFDLIADVKLTAACQN
ncbi:MAG TPA: hypothetical protein VF648_12885 [Pyrinomonadaceae bacterium]|jgi:hypothetical protein